MWLVVNKCVCSTLYFLSVRLIPLHLCLWVISLYSTTHTHNILSWMIVFFCTEKSAFTLHVLYWIISPFVQVNLPLHYVYTCFVLDFFLFVLGYLPLHFICFPGCLQINQFIFSYFSKIILM